MLDNTENPTLHTVVKGRALRGGIYNICKRCILGMSGVDVGNIKGGRILFWSNYANHMQVVSCFILVVRLQEKRILTLLEKKKGNFGRVSVVFFVPNE